MILPTEDWLEMPDGSRYHGETDEPDYCSLLKDGRYDELVTMALDSPCQMTTAASTPGHSVPHLFTWKSMAP